MVLCQSPGQSHFPLLCAECDVIRLECDVFVICVVYSRQRQAIPLVHMPVVGKRQGER